MALKRMPAWYLTVIRCGQTAWEAEHRLRGATDLPLDETGLSQVRAMGHLLKRDISLIAHPTDEAAAQTASELAALVGARTRAVAELADPDLGLLEGLTLEAFAERYPTRAKQWANDLLNVSPPQGEDVQSARARVFRAMTEVLRKSKSPETAVVLHPIALGLLRCYVSSRPASAAWAMLEKRPPVERYLLSRESLAKLAEVPVLQAAG